MAEKPQAIVTASFEIPAKLAWHLEELLRGLTAQLPCKVLQVTTEVKVDAESTLQQDEPGPGRIEQGDGISAVDSDAGENGELAGRAGKDAKEPSRGRTDAREHGSVRGEKGRNLKK